VISRLMHSRALHFVVLGAIFYALSAYFFPPPKPIVGPLSQARVDALVAEWQNLMGRKMRDNERQGLLQAELDRDMLFMKAIELELHAIDPVVQQRLLRNIDFLGLYAEQSEAEKLESAYEMRMHLGDEVIKRRLIQLTEEWLLLKSPPQAVSVADIETFFNENADQFLEDQRLSFSHVFFPRERESDMLKLKSDIESQGLVFETALKRGAPFLAGYTFQSLTADQIARQFGAGFVTNLMAQDLSAETWLPPIASTFGWHLVSIAEVKPARAQTLDEASDEILATLNRERRLDALDRAKAELRKDYEVVL